MIAGLIRLLTGAQARWTGCAPDPVQRIYFANHTSHLDFPVIWASLPPALRLLTRPVAARDYWDATRLRRYLAKDVFRAIMIERNAAGRDNPLRPMEEALSAGDSLIIFPEGTRAVDEDAGLAPFKSGLYHLAQRYPDVQLVPVHLENLNRILPKGKYLLIPLLAAVSFGAPIRLLPEEDKRTFLDRARAVVARLEEAHA
ncbi:MAG TPA: lysophospholipid acyltransferase family protein [Candidatus Binataceae bacterium]|nr:lysophospholipid acyltransferase family protein [Candidatus Binataceae bacterium]